MNEKITHRLFWLGSIILLFLFVYLIHGILLPFVVGILAAYFLDPAADKLEEWGASRAMATTIITIGFFATIALFIILLSPLIYEQVSDFIIAVPGYLDTLHQRYDAQFESLMNRLGLKRTETQQILGQSTAAVAGVAGGVLGHLWKSGVAAVNILSLVFLTPVVCFYLLRDWDKLVAKIDALLPRAYADTIRQQAKAVDRVLSGFIRGQTNVCLFLAAFYAVGLSLIGLEFGLVLGIASGLLTFMPYVGAAVGASTSILIALLQFGSWQGVAATAAVFIIGQTIESYFMTPKLVGDRVGLHPLWIIFGMLVGGTLFGFVGVLIAVPVTAVTGVLVRFALSRYLTSRYYA